MSGASEFTDDALPEAVLNNGTLSNRSERRLKFRFSSACWTAARDGSCRTSRSTTFASLGKSNGERPFRLLAQPITFLPRSTIRLQIVERSQGVQGNLFVVFYGYQVVGSSGCPELGRAEAHRFADVPDRDHRQPVGARDPI